MNRQSPYFTKQLKEHLVQSHRYPSGFVRLLSSTDAPKLWELHALKKLAYVAAFDARVLANGFDPANLTEDNKRDICMDITFWSPDKNPEDPANIHLKRWDELFNQIKDVLKKYQNEWWRVSVLDLSVED